MVHVAITSSCGNQAPRETEKGIAAAMERDGRFDYQLTSYQNITGVTNSRKIFDLIILFVKGENEDD